MRSTWALLAAHRDFRRLFLANVVSLAGDLAVAGGAHDDQARWDVSAALFY